MSRALRKKEKYINKNEFSRNHRNDGTAARTRPLSFDEIMLRRKNKKQSGNVEDLPEEAGIVSVKSVEKVSGHVEADRHRRNDFVASSPNHASDDFVKVSSRKKEDSNNIKEGKSMKVEDKETRDTERKSKATFNRNSNGDEAKGGKEERLVHEKRKNYDRSSDDCEKESGMRRYNESKDKYAERNREKPEKVSKRKSQNEDDERTRDRSAGKKHESRNWHDSEVSERNERMEASQFRHGDSRSKRRRSRSREHDKDESRRSISPSFRGHKHRSYDVREHGDLSLHASKDTSGRIEINSDRKKISNNGPSNNSRRHGVSSSRLGGYSPRKRRSEAAVKTPSPTGRSPEKKSAGWDFPPARAESKLPVSVQSNLPPSNHTVLSTTQELSSVMPLTSSTPKPIVGVVSSTPSFKISAAVDSIQLTQATRPKRRLYVENLPASATEEAIMECLNNYLLSSGVKHLQGAQPCISCIVHKEKAQALVEFLTPQDASAALSFDGRSFFGSILKIRRPKDYVEVTTGAHEKPLASADPIRDIVEDSPHKIFVGGISMVVSSKMLMEIASAFGPLKAYRFESNVELSESCAFLEYVDPSATLKACVGLNGMRLGGQVLTVVQAIADATSVENVGHPPFYGIPEHARSLLEKPSKVLKLKNVFDPSSLLSLSEPELEEILEDVRIECARFGVVKSVNVVKFTDRSTSSEACEAADNAGLYANEDGDDNKDKEGDLGKVGRPAPSGSAKELVGVEEPTEANSYHDDKLESSHLKSSTREPEEANKAVEANIISDDKLESSHLMSCTREPEEVNKAVEANIFSDDQMEGNLVKDENGESVMIDGVIDQTLQENSTAIYDEFSDQLITEIDRLESRDDKLTRVLQTGDLEIDFKSEEDNKELELVASELDNIVKTDTVEKDENKETPSDLNDVFEPGCVLVEYKREEASSMAAHGLHGRLFDDRIVTVEYVAHAIYRAMFPK